MSLKALLNTLSSSSRTLPIVILYVTEGCNLRCITCSYRNALPGELTLAEITELAGALKQFRLRHIVYSGGEPLLRHDLPDICDVFQNLGVKQTLLTNGLLLEKRSDELMPYFAEIIVSIDGPLEHVHNIIRGVESFQQILKGVRKAVGYAKRPIISIRTVLQKQNFRYVIEMVRFARSLGADRISFLSADVLSDSFGRHTRGPVASNETIILNEDEASEFRNLVDHMASECRNDFQAGFISESPDQLYHMVQYFEALTGKAPFPRNHCNAPMVSTVITSTGELQPCFFLPAFANLRNAPLKDLLNNSQICSTRREVRAYALERCHTCVCTLHVQPLTALLDRF